LKVSPSFLDQYISAARQVIGKAVGNPAARPGSSTYRASRAPTRKRSHRRLTPGDACGLIVEHLFPADGEYKFNVAALRARATCVAWEYRHTVVMTIDGAKVFENQIGWRGRYEVHRSEAGPGGCRDQRPLPEHHRQREGGTAQSGRHVHRRTFAESDEVSVFV